MDDAADAAGRGDEPTVEVVMTQPVVELLQSLTRQVVEVHDEDVDRAGPVAGRLAARLYPNAGLDPDVDAAVRSLVHDEVMDQRRDDLAALQRLLSGGEEVAGAPRTGGGEDDDEEARAGSSEDPPATQVRFRWDADEAATVLRTTHVVTLALALQHDPEVFSDDRDAASSSPEGRRQGVATMLVDLLHDLHGVVLAQLDPGSVRSATAPEDE